MDRCLSSLTRLFMYIDADSQLPYCEIHFKGDIDAFETVPVDTLLGDLINLTENADFKKMMHDGHLFDYVDSLVDYSSSSKVIFHSYYFDEVVAEIPNVLLSFNPVDESDFHYLDLGLSFEGDKAKCVQWISGKTHQEEFLSLLGKEDKVYNPYSRFGHFLDTINKMNIRYSRDTLDAFQCTYGDCMYECQRKMVDNVNKPESFSEEFEYSSFSLEDSLLCQDVKKLVYKYDCDCMAEVIMALLHYLAVVGAPLNKCKRCGRWFAPVKKTDEKYCLRQYTPRKNCRQLAVHEARIQRLNAHPVNKKINSVNTNIAKWKNSVKDDPERWTNRTLQGAEFHRVLNSKKETLTDIELFEWLNTVSVKGDRLTWK